MSKTESLFSVHIEDGIALLVFCILFLYFYVNNYEFIDTLIYAAMISGIVGAIVYFLRKLWAKFFKKNKHHKLNWLE